MLLIRDLAHNPGMFPDWESNQQLSGLQSGAQSTEPHQPGQEEFIFEWMFQLGIWLYYKK